MYRTRSRVAGMTILAHLSDLHLIERRHFRRGALDRSRLALLSVGTPLDAEARIAATKSALAEARRLGAEHVVLTGDLTEDGRDEQFEVLAEVLADSGIAAERITIVPGNHDGYSEPGTYARALAGPLASYRGTSAPGACTVLEDAIIKPISTMLEGQWIVRAGGLVRPDDVHSIRRLANDTVSRTRALVIAQHHPLGSPAWAGLEWFDGVENGRALHDLLLERTRLHVLHGHVHARATRNLCGREHAQVFCTASVRDQHQTLRLYKAEDCTLRELGAPTLQPVGSVNTSHTPLLAATPVFA